MKGVIYIIRNTINNKFYLGSTTNFKDRKRRHLQDLRREDHHNMHLQNAYKKYGEEAFEFQIKYESEDIKADEQRELDNLDWLVAYNLSPHAVGGDMNATHPNREEIYKKISETQKKMNRKPPNRIKVCINRIEYDSYHDASNDLDIPVVTIRYRCLSKNIKYQDWNIVGKEKSPNQLYVEGDSQGQDIRCEGIDFPSYAAAHRHFDLSITAVIHRVDSPNFPTWLKR